MCLVSLILASCGGGGSEGSPKGARSATVSISDFKYQPDPIEIKAGGTITWTNRDSAPHTAQTKDGAKGAFHTGTLKKGGSKRLTFRTPGQYKYFCSYHRFMTGTVEVEK